MSLNLKNEIYSKFSLQEIKVFDVISSVVNIKQTSAFLIGGCVRDLLLGNRVKDIDITIEGNAVDFCKFLEKNYDCKILEIQDKLKTVKMTFFNSVSIDFASTREEKYPVQGHLPVACNFGCKLESDVKRRDFTINTLAVSLSPDKEYCLVDYLDGYDDLKEGIIRIIHNESFKDDPSRIIRALKFKERLNFSLDITTEELMTSYLSSPDYSVPAERIKQELKQYFNIGGLKMYKKFVDSNAYKLISDESVIMPDFNLIDKSKKIYPDIDEFFIFIALLIINLTKDINRLNLTSKEKLSLKQTKELLSKNFDKYSDKDLYYTFTNCTEEAKVLYFVIKNDNCIKKFFNELQNIKVNITGKDLIEAGLKPSKLFGEIFDKIIEKKITGSISTKEEEIEFALKYAKEK